MALDLNWYLTMLAEILGHFCSKYLSCMGTPLISNQRLVSTCSSWNDSIYSLCKGFSVGVISI